MKTLFLILSLVALAFVAQSATIVGNRFDTNADNVVIAVTNVSFLTTTGAVTLGSQYQDGAGNGLPAFYTNGVLALPSSQPIAFPYGLQFLNTNGNVLAYVASTANHGGVGIVEATFSSLNDLSLRPGLSLSVGSGAQGLGQIGVSGNTANLFFIQYEDDASGTYADGLSTQPKGHSHRLGFPATASSAGAGEAFPGIVGFANGSTVSPANYGNWIPGELAFYSMLPYYNSGGIKYTLSSGYEQGRVLTNGWNMRGKLIAARATDSISGSTYSFDFNAGGRLVDISIATASATPTITFSTVNSTELTSDYESKVFAIRSLGYTPTFVWPAGFAQFGASAGAALPTTMSPVQIMRVQIESVGTGTTNKWVTVTFGNDLNFAWDGDALNFFQRAYLTNSSVSAFTLSQSNAINNRVLNAKAHGYWSKWDSYWPMVGGTSNLHAINLRSNETALTWHGTLAAVAAHTSLGVTNDGTAGNYADTHFQPATHTGVYSLNSAHFMAYIGGPLRPASCRIMGSTGVNGRSANMEIVAGSPGQLFVQENDATRSAGPFENNFVPNANDWRGPIWMTRTSSGGGLIRYNGLTPSTTDGNSSVALPTGDNVILFDRTDGGGTTTPNGNIFIGNLRSASIGSGLTEQNMTDMKTDEDAFQNALGRQVP